MSFFSKIRGTIEQAFALGLGGPQWKRGTSPTPNAIDARDATDSAFAVVRVADPIDCDDAVNLRTLEQRLGSDACGNCVKPTSLFGPSGSLYEPCDEEQENLYSGGSAWMA